MDFDKDDKISFLWNASKIFASNNPTNKVLRAHYLRSCYAYDQNLSSLHKTLFSRENVCPKCANPWIDGQFSINVKRKRYKLDETAKKLLEIYKSDQFKLKRKEKLKAKWILKQNRRIMTISCNACDAITEFSLEQPITVLPNAKNKSSSSNNNPNLIANAKTKKTKASNTKGSKGKTTITKKPNISATKQSNHLLKIAEMLKNSNKKGNETRLNSLLK